MADSIIQKLAAKVEQKAQDNTWQQEAARFAQSTSAYYQQNRAECYQIMNNVDNLMVKSVPITAESTGYKYAVQRLQRTIEDMNNIMNCDNNENWSIVSAFISEEEENASRLVVGLKNEIKLKLRIDSEYPLKPPVCELDTTGMKKPLSFNNHPCVAIRNKTTFIGLFERTWSPSLTLHDVVHFCSVIVQGEDPTSLVQTYVRIYHDRTVNEMLTKGTMKDYLLKYTNPICKCGAQMVQINNKDCYVNQYWYVICDGCDIICRKENGAGKQIVYHCPNEKLPQIHPDGYDICFDCVYKHHLRYRQFNALIISPSIKQSAWNVECKDAEKLDAMFKQLGYHNVTTLKDNQCTKQRIKAAVDKLYHVAYADDNNINKVNVIVYTGHGNHFHGQFWFDIADGLLSEKELKSWIYGHEMKNENEAQDGYAKCKQALYKNKKQQFHRQNTLLLINACHSGGFQALNRGKVGDKASGGILEQAVDDISNQMNLGFNLQDIIKSVDNVNEDEQKHEETEEKTEPKQAMMAFLKYVDDGLNEVMNEVSYNTHSALVISSCQKDEFSNYFGDLSPFVEYVLAFFAECKREIKATGDESVTSFIQYADTPMRLYEYVEKRGRTPHKDNGIVLSDLQQNVTVASKRGSDQFVLCPLY